MRNYVTTFDPFFDLFFQSERKNNVSYLMDTDIIEKPNCYLMKINLPEVKKEDLKVSLENGYLKVEVTLNEEKQEENNYILKERNYGTYYRSYNVGKDIKMKDISAKLENGLLTLTINKPNEEELIKEKYIEIQ